MRIALTALLVLAAAPAWAEWEKVSENNAVVFYVDPATLRTEGALRRSWELQDLKVRDSDGELSRLSLFEYDCSGARYRILFSSAHAGQMATGEVILDVSNPDADQTWDHADPGTLALTRLRHVCDWVALRERPSPEPLHDPSQDANPGR
jgi:hypothetical protein